jgi:hypothetical protein
MKTYYRITIAILVMMISIIISQGAFAAEAMPGRETMKPQTKQTPDVKPSSLEAMPGSPQAGQIVSLKGIYEVTGCISDPFYGKMEVDGQIIGEEQELDNMCPNCAHPSCHNKWDWYLVVPWEAVPGSHTITFTVDSKNNISEGVINETNNTKSITVNVPMPDIQVPEKIHRKPIIPRRK